MKKSFLMVVVALAVAVQANAYSIIYNLTGCSADETTNEAEVTNAESELYFDLSDGYVWDGATFSVSVGTKKLDNGVECLGGVEEEQFLIYIMLADTTFYADVTVTLSAKKAPLVYPSVFTAATFENVVVGENGVYYNPNLGWGVNRWLDGSFNFSTFYDNSYGDYYSDVVVSNVADSSLKADYNNPVSYLSAAVNHTAQGNNFAVWNQNYYGVASVLLEKDTVISGMAITNTSATINYILDNPSSYPQGSWFALNVEGKKDGVKVGEVTFYLVDFRTANDWKYAANWQWFDLTSLGSVDELVFTVDGSDKNDYGLLTPAYFCFDNLGGSKEACTLGEMTKVVEEPTALQQTNSDQPKATKRLINGQLYIEQNNRLYTLTGVAL